MNLLLTGVLLAILIVPYPDLKHIRFSGTAQGTTYQVSYFASELLVSKPEIDSVLQVIDYSLSLYRPHSLINQFNNSAYGIQADEHLKNVVTKAIEVYHETGGLFDITVGPLTAAWGFGPSRQKELPRRAAINKILPCVNSSLITFKDNFLTKGKPCVQLDPNGIAQGYTVDVLASFLEAKGISNYLVELGGEIRIRGRKLPGNERMTVGIEVPAQNPGQMEPSMMEKIVAMEGGALTTSGNYRRYHESKGKKITHIIDPRTGYPCKNELVSATVYAKDAITADAYDNALMLMGLEKAMSFVDSHPQLSAHFIYLDAGGRIGDTMTAGFRSLIATDN